ncbi:MAG TPA: alkaline phosphatase family protein [Candidatus Tumulicola sp.]|nr:alkaline phosphatase family protein [Candidatus Tumulicola sp.]
MTYSSRVFRPFLLAAALAAAGCGGSSGGSSAVPPGPKPTPSPGAKIQHVVILIQENRTTDDLFNGFPGADTVTKGLGKDPSQPGKQIVIPLKRVALRSKLTPANGYEQFLAEYDGGKMDGFNTVPVEHNPGTYVYQYVNPADVAPYWALGKQYVFADRMFQTQGSGSFTAHQDLIAGGTLIDDTHALIDNPSNEPWGCDAPHSPPTVTSLITTAKQFLPDKGPFPCLDYKTLRDLLDAKGVGWKYYTPKIGQSFAGNIWNAFDAIRAVRYGPEWSANIAEPATLLTDISSGKLPSVAWVCPEFDNSDHPGAGSDTGPSWIGQVVDALGESSYWNTTAIVVVWDDWGGFYDHVAPPQIDYQGLGFRVPMVIVSPYAKSGLVSHERYEFGSIVKFVEDRFGLGRLGTTDVRANSLDGVFDFSKPPRAFVPIRTKYSRAFFLHQAPSNHPLDGG